MKIRNKQCIQIDDLEVGTCMTVFKNHFLKGSVLQVQAMNLPYLFVHVTDPLRGRQNLAVDVRDHIFMPLNDEYIRAILAETPESAVE